MIKIYIFLYNRSINVLDHTDPKEILKEHTHRMDSYVSKANTAQETNFYYLKR